MGEAAIRSWYTRAYLVAATALTALTVLSVGTGMHIVRVSGGGLRIAFGLPFASDWLILGMGALFGWLCYAGRADKRLAVFSMTVGANMILPMTLVPSALLLAKDEPYALNMAPVLGSYVCALALLIPAIRTASKIQSLYSVPPAARDTGRSEPWPPPARKPGV